MMLSALILMSGLISAPSDQSDVLWQPQAAAVPTDITQAEAALQQHPENIHFGLGIVDWIPSRGTYRARSSLS